MRSNQQTNDRLTRSARLVVRLAKVANRGFLLAVGLGLVLSLALPGQLAGLVERWFPGAEVSSVMLGMRLEMLLGLAMAAVTDRILAALAQVLASAGAGEPFVAGNAARLRTIGWCLLALQLCEVPGALIGKYFPDLGSAAPTGDFSIAGWIAVLLVFVLARVFEVGAGMRQELDGTV